MTAPTFPAETPFGPVGLTVMDQNHIVVRTSAAGNGWIVIDQEELRVQAELHRAKDGTWQVQDPHDLLVLRRDHRRWSGEHADAIMEALGYAVSEWVRTYPILLAVAADAAQQEAPGPSHAG